eukprot:CAMPEP_0114573458 /NCGR_PEP_ID=MMETSP0114-20121206/18875_1 /TAXON_ID=31324 /ORGANISM="Goniomonas sp, Strain m" /LENGTH=205 /DNA_ID=CAMNT_0001760815 /DNA_START=227 /DNA_END=841 /DNA_ORIENTATION=-
MKFCACACNHKGPDCAHCKDEKNQYSKVVQRESFGGDALEKFATQNSEADFAAAGKTAVTLLGNVEKNPEEAKYRKLNLTNPKLQAALLRFNGAVELMMAAGFVKVRETLVLPTETDLDGLISTAAQLRHRLDALQESERKLRTAELAARQAEVTALKKAQDEQREMYLRRKEAAERKGWCFQSNVHAAHTARQKEGDNCVTRPA